MKFRFQQLTHKGMWTSPEVFEGAYRDIVREVLGGHVEGQARAAVEEGTGRVIYAVDARGLSTAASVALFDTIVKAK